MLSGGREGLCGGWNGKFGGPSEGVLLSARKILYRANLFPLRSGL